MFFYYIVFKQNGLVLNNSLGLVKNIGCDGTGQNCGYSLTDEKIVLSEKKVSFFPDIMIADDLVWERLKDYYRNANHGVLYRALIVFTNEGLEGVIKRLCLRYRKILRRIEHSLF